MLQEKINGLRIEVDNTTVPFTSSSVVEVTDVESGDPHWDYSKSTSRHFTTFLNEFVVGGWSIAQMTRKEKEKYFEENNLFKELP